jgi:hypothetical protein
MEDIKKFYTGQTVELQLVVEPVEWVPKEGGTKGQKVAKKDPVECIVRSVKRDEGTLDFERMDRKGVIFHNHRPGPGDKVLKDVPRPAGEKPQDLPVIKRLHSGEKVLLALPVEPIEWVKGKDGKSRAKTAQVACTVHGVSVVAGTISFTKDKDPDKRVYNNFVVTNDNLLADEIDEADGNEKSLDKMNKDELVAKAKELGIKLTIEDGKVKETKAEIIKLLEAAK